MKKVSILGTEYSLEEATQFVDPALAEIDGYCDTSVKRIVFDSGKTVEGVIGAKRDQAFYAKKVMRHEIIHAFLYESGLDVETWAQNEETVDWIAVQFPKMLAAFESVGAL